MWCTDPMATCLLPRPHQTQADTSHQTGLDPQLRERQLLVQLLEQAMARPLADDLPSERSSLGQTQPERSGRRAGAPVLRVFKTFMRLICIAR